MASLLELVEALVRDPQAKAAYRANPDDFLGRHGFAELEPSDLEEALHHAADSFPPALAAQVSPVDGFDSLVQVDLQELGYDDDLRPRDPLHDTLDDDTDDWRGPDLGDDVEFDAPLADDGPAHDRLLDEVDDARTDGHLDDGEREDGDPADGDGVRGGLLGPEAELDSVRPPPSDTSAAADIDAADRSETDGITDADGLGPNGLGSESLTDADWGDDDPWFYSEREPVLEESDDFDDDIMDDVDDFHHDT